MNIQYKFFCAKTINCAEKLLSSQNHVLFEFAKYCTMIIAPSEKFCFALMRLHRLLSKMWKICASVKWKKALEIFKFYATIKSKMHAKA